MKAWLLRWWNDEAWFSSQMSAAWRFGLALIGYLMQQHVIPTGIDGGGEKYGALLMILPFLVAAGNKTRSREDETRQVMQVEVSSPPTPTK